MTTDDRLFSLIRRISAIESQLVTRRSFLGSTDTVGARYYRELQELRHELDVRLGYGTHGTATEENPADVSPLEAGRRPGGAGRGPRGVRTVAARVLGQRCAGSESCSGVCWGSVAGRNSRGHGPEADVFASVSKPSSDRSEADFAPIPLKSRPQRAHRADI